MDVSVQIAYTRVFFQNMFIWPLWIMKSEGAHSGSGFYFLQDPILILTIPDVGLYRGHE